MTHKDFTGRLVLVTGATSGIGRASALALAKAGAQVIATGRKQAALEQLDDAIKAVGGEATLVPLDLKEGEQIDRLGAAVHERWGKLDGFLSAAGLLGELTPLGHMTPNLFDEVMAVNMTATWRLIRSLDPLLQASDAGRAVFFSSGAATTFRAFWGPYGASKAASDALAYTYAAECEATNVRANILNPGATATPMRAKAMPGEDPATLPRPEDVADLALEMAHPDYAENGAYVNYRDWRSAR